MTNTCDWPTRLLGDLAETALGKMLDRGKSRGLPHVPYLRNVNVQWDQIDTSDLREMELANDERDRFGVKQGDLLICEGGEVGRAAIWQGSAGYIAYQKALHRVRSHGELDLKFLRYLLEHYVNTGLLAARSTGSTIAHLPQEKLRTLPVPCPELTEQKRLVEILDDHLSRISEATIELLRIESKLDALLTSTLVSDSSIAEAERVALQDLLTHPLTNGKSVPTQAGGFPVLRLTALNSGGIDLSQRKEGAWDELDATPFLVRHGDFLVSRGNGSLRLLARGGLVRDEPDPVAFPDTLIRFRLNRERVDSEFFSAVWNSILVRPQIESMGRTTAGIYKVNQKDLAAIKVPLPGMRDQVRLAKLLKSQAIINDEMKHSTQIARRRSEALRSALLAAVFSGHFSERSWFNRRREELAGV